MLKRREWIWAAMLLLAGAAPAQAARLLCCSDDGGRRYCGDVLPDACAKRAYTEIDERGLRGADHAAPLTEAQIAAREAADKAKRESAKVVLDQKRRDQALLATYANETELDSARDRGVNEMMRAIKQSQDKIEQAQKEQKKLNAQIAAAADPDEKAELKEQLSRFNVVIKGQQDAIAAKNGDIEKLKAKFEADRQRLRELRNPSRNEEAGS